MTTLITDTFLLLQSTFSPTSRFPSTKNTIFIHSSRQRFTCKPNPLISHSTSASNHPNFSIYGGWDDLELMEESGDSGFLDPFRSLIISLGIDDKKHTFPFFLGFFAALTLSRVKFFTVALLPVSILVFLCGFFVGVAQAGFFVKKMGRNEKLKQLEVLFNDVDGKMSYLREGLEGVSADENYVQIVEYVKVAIGEVQKTLNGSFSNEVFGEQIDFDFGAKKIDFFQFFTGLFHESLVGSKANKMKNGVNEKFGRESNRVDAIGEVRRSQLRSVNQEISNVEEHGIGSNDKRGRIDRKIPEKDKSDNNSNDVAMLSSVKYNFKIGSSGSDMFSFDEEDDSQNSSSSSLQFMNNRGSFQKIVLEQSYEREAFNSHSHDSADGNIFGKRSKNMEHLKRESKSSLHEHTLGVQNNAHQPSCSGESSVLKEKQINGFDFEETTATLRNYPSLGNQRLTNAKGEGKKPYSSNISMDDEFADSIKEASYLLKHAKEYMMSQAGEEQADGTLYKAADLLSAAIVTRPMSLVAVGQLGNTYLLHGELKLKITRELRTLLLRSDSLFSGKPGGLRLKKNDSIVTSREDIASILFSACEECEGLLVKAGRTYRRALSIDGNDVRALYNWGLALCFRAQLIADVGPEAALDADKVYLAAIDKFNAMMSGSNAFAPNALYRWGMVLRQRSHLRQNNSREKSKLLHQAKSLFEEVLSMDSDNQLVRHALLSCISELNNTQL